MKPIAVKSVKPFRLIALAAVTAGVTHVVGLPAFVDAVMSVGADMQLPLERMASDAPDALETLNAPQAAHAARRQGTPASAANATQLTDSKNPLRPRAAPRPFGLAPGYRQSIADSKHWT